MDNETSKLSGRIGGIVHGLRDAGATLVEIFEGDRLGQIGVIILLGFIFMGLFAPLLAPADPGERYRGDDGTIERTTPPSSDHYLGTTNLGRDIASQVVYGSRVSLLVGTLAAFMAVFIGTNIGLVAGYKGGIIDDALMRLTDLAYGIPFLPFIVVLVAILQPSIWNVVAAIGFILWRTTARVIRSQVLSHKERPYVESAKAVGASDIRIMYLHILPNVLPLVFLYAAFSVAWAVVAEASISFLGFGDPTLYSWGQMIFEAYNADAIRHAWWWVVPPGISIMLLVMAVFFIGRTLEKLSNPELQEAR